MTWQWAALLGARVLIGALFVAGAGQKLVSPGVVEGLLADRSWPVWLVWPAAVYDLAAGVLLIGGVWVTPVALSMAAYCAATSLFHFVPADGWQMSIFVKNWAIAGGCLALAVAASGAASS